MYGFVKKKISNQNRVTVCSSLIPGDDERISVPFNYLHLSAQPDYYQTLNCVFELRVGYLNVLNFYSYIKIHITKTCRL